MSACFTSVQAYNGCAGFRPGDSDPRQNMPQQRIWKPVPWSPSVPKTKSAKQQRKAALNTNDVFSAESLAKHKVSIADVLLSEPQFPASPAKRGRDKDKDRDHEGKEGKEGAEREKRPAREEKERPKREKYVADPDKSVEREARDEEAERGGRGGGGARGARRRRRARRPRRRRAR